MPDERDDIAGPASDVSVVVPVHNSEATIPVLVAALVETLEAHGGGFEILLVDDRSTDRSWEAISAASFADRRVTGIRLERNVGEQGAVLCGIDHSSSRVIVTIDDDLEQPPDAIPLLLAELDAGADLVYGDLGSTAHGLWRRASARAVKWSLAIALGSAHACSLSSYRALRAEVVERAGRPIGSRPSIDGWLSQGARLVASVPVSHQSRRAGSSGYAAFDLWVHASSLFTQYAGRPERVGWLAMVAAGGTLGVLVAGGVIAAVLGATVLPWAIGAAVAGVLVLAVFLLALALDHLVQIRSHLVGEEVYAVADTTRSRSPEG
ncbi:glycosyltransferase family 2 protein [Aquihabitans daechungensis]|uniref:glycosyltransferase family 2 protein n=1 Tax=Aquihabitans daechungensis TaxID=1052257 RepID=UPI003BA17FFF